MSGVSSRKPFELFKQQLERLDKKRLERGKSFSGREDGRKKKDEDKDLIFHSRGDENVGVKKSNGKFEEWKRRGEGRERRVTMRFIYRLCWLFVYCAIPIGFADRRG